MSLAIGPITKLGSTSNSAQLSCAAPGGGTGPYTQKWYKSFTTGFTPGAAYEIPGATGLTLTDINLLPGVTYYYKVRVTDTGNGGATADSAQLTVDVPAGDPVEMNSFVQYPILGQVTLGMNTNTQSVVLDSSVVGQVLPGTAVRQIAPTGVSAASGLQTLPHVVPCDADSDDVTGFVQYSLKNPYFLAGDAMEISKTGNVQYQMATANGTAGDHMQLDLSVVGGLQSVVGSSGATVCGRALDTPIVGQVFRLEISVLPKVTA